MTYTSADNVKAMVDDANKPTTISDAQIFQFIVDGDSFIDTFTNTALGGHASSYSTSSFDSSTDRTITAASTLRGAATLLRRIAVEDQMGEEFVTGPISEKLLVRQQEFMKLAIQYEKESVDILKTKIAGVYSVRRTL